MSPSPSSTGASSAPLPPLPGLPAQPKPAPGGADSPLAGLMSGIAPVKNAVDSIRSACQQIVQSGAIPGAEQICAQIIALATGLVPMAAQNLLQPVMGAGGGGPSAGGPGAGPGPMPPPPGGPAPLPGVQG